MKHWLTAILVVLMCWTLVGCGGDSGKPPPPAPGGGTPATPGTSATDKRVSQLPERGLRSSLLHSWGCALPWIS
jgi:hypothetical protein